MGTRYQGYTLIGGAKQPEEMVIRDDAFDCVTFCEVVLAAAAARNRAEFEPHAQENPLSRRQGRLARAQSLLGRLVPAQHRQQGLRAR